MANFDLQKLETSLCRMV